MQQGLSLLIQLVLELAPIIVSLVQNKKEPNLFLTKLEPLKQIPKLLESASEPSKVNEFQQQKLWQQQLVVYDRQTQVQIAAYERETALKLPEADKILDSWPLRLYPSQILDANHRNIRTPLKVFIAPPKIKFDEFDGSDEASEVELILAEGLRDFLNQHYSLHSEVRPTEFLAGAWNSKRFHSESSIKALFGILKSEPILILESETDGDYLNFRIGYWGLRQDNYYYKTISRIPYREILNESAKSRAWEWMKIRDQLLFMGEDLEEINDLGGDNVTNLAILSKAEKWKSQGIDVSKLSLQYKTNRQDIEKLSQVLVTCHCLVAGWIADAYHLVDHDVPPLLPQLLPNLLQDSPDLQAVQVIASGYTQLYQALETERRYWIPELALQLGYSLSYLPDRSWASAQVDYSLNTWLQLRQVSLPEVCHPLQAMQSAVTIEDAEYVQRLREYFAAVEDLQSIAEVEEILQAIANLKHQRQEGYAYFKHTLVGHLGKISSVAISSDGQTLVSGCTDTTAKVWNIKTGKCIRTITVNLGEVSSVAINPDGDVIAIGGGETPRNNVKIWNLKTSKLTHTLLGHHKPVNVVTISSDGQILASGSNKIKIWNLPNGDRLCTLWHSSSVNAIAITPDVTTLISGTSDHKIRLWNPHTGEPLHTFIGHFSEVKSLAISPDGKTIFSGSSDKTIKIWNLETGKLLHTLTGHTDEVKSLAISPDGLILISGSSDKTIKIWRWQSGELLQTITEHSGAVNSLAISSDGSFFVSGSSDATIKVWQIIK